LLNDPRFLILRCHPRDTLNLSLLNPDLLCPTTTIQVRRGPSRQRETITIPILPSFLFYPHPIQSIQLSFPRFSHKLHIMKRPPLPYATCTLSEITIMSTTHALLAIPPDGLTINAHVEVTDGLLCGCTGTILNIKTNGDITLKIKEHLGWQINTCIVNASVLRLL